MSIINSSNFVGGAVHVTGLAELYATLQEIPKQIETNIMRGAMRAGCNVIADEARRLVPVRHGQLRESIRVSVRVSNGRVIAMVKAGGRFKVYAAGKAIKGADYRTAKASGGFDYHTPFYAHFVEFGTAAHTISSKRGMTFGGGVHKFVKHPGARPRPFMRPAFDRQAGAAVEAAAEYIRTRLPKELAKLRKGGRNG